jgi:cytochrome P450
MLLNAHDSETGSMNSRQLRDEITTIFMAGHETTAQTLSWVLYEIAKRPDHIYSNGVINETMRMYPPVWIMARKSISEDIIDGYTIPAKSTVLVNVYGMNYSERCWKDPDEFDPTRFDTQDNHPFLFIPFGGGQRPCIGKSFAMLIMQTVLEKLLAEFDFRIPPGFKPETHPGVTLRAKKGIHLLLQHKKFLNREYDQHSKFTYV